MNDLRFAIRMLLKNPGFTAVAVLTLALGIGANSALFSVVNKVLLSPLPFPDPERLMFLRETDPANHIEDHGVSGLAYLDWCDRSQSFAALGAVQFGSKLSLSGRGEPLLLRGGLVTPSFFDVFAFPMQLGRPFRPDESERGKEKVVILSHGLWQRAFGGDTNIIGQAVTLAGEPYVVVGVGARTLGFIEQMFEAYTPIPDAQLRASRGNHTLGVFGRLKPTVSVEQAGAELRTIAAAIGLEHGLQGRSATVVPLRERIVREVRPAFLVLYAAVLLVLGIACANVANLLLARSEARRREIAVRAALGAGRGRIIRQLLTESVLLSLAGAGVGLVLAQLGLELLRHSAPRLGGEPIPFFDEIAIDGRVLLFTLLVAVVTGILFGLAPAWSAAKVNLMDTLKEASRGSSGTVRRHRLLNSFVVTQLALSVGLLVGAGLLGRSFARLTRVHPGFDASQLLTMATDLSPSRYTNQARCRQFYQAVLEAVRALPNVESAEAINLLPMNGEGTDMSFDLEGAEPLPPGRLRIAQNLVVSPDYSQTMRIPLRQGRHLARADEGQHQVVLVNEAFVRRFLPGANPLGRRVSFHTGTTNWLEIVGVLADVKDSGLGSKTRPAVYQPFTQTCGSRMSLTIRTRGEPMHLARAVQEQIWRIDAAQPVTNVKPMQEWVRESVSVERFSAGLLLGFALIGLVLAGVGLFGVMAYAVSQRTHEFGVRLAMGAPIGVILRLVLVQGLKVAGLGLGLGLAGALALSVVLQSLLFEMRAQDPLTFLVVVVFLALVALAACYLPARRATKVDPMVALRCE